MNKFLAAVFAFTIFTIAGNQVLAQKQPLVTTEGKIALENLSVQYNNQYKAGQQRAVALAARHGWPLRRKTQRGVTIALQNISPLGFPVYVKTYNNAISAATTQTNAVQPGGVLGLNLSGSSAVLNGKLAIWDGGLVYAGHQEFSGKTITFQDAGADIDEHATHVAGTLIAKGVYAPSRGMSFGAATLSSYTFDNDVTEMSSSAAGLLLSNHSYGSIAGWNYDSDASRWEWYGLPGDTVDYKFGFYDSYSQSYDRIAYNAPYYTIVVAAGNSRDQTGPAIGEFYYGFRSRTDATLISKGARTSGISNNNGYDIIPLQANAKNVITVGAIEPLPYGPANRQDLVTTSFSSWGPTDDGRIKPDLVGNGDNVLSTDNTGPADYLTLSGTSMSTPNITGSLLLLQEYYAQKNNGNFMQSATLKGLACHTAFDGGNIGPDYIYGWGLLDMRKAAQTITDNGTKSILGEYILQQGKVQTYTVTASGNGTLAASIAWTDPEGTPTADGTINDRTSKLVNDLDIRVSDDTNTYMPWILDPNNPAAAATHGDNIRDNIEQITIDDATPGKAYTITVSHKKTLQSGAQAYSLIVTGAGGNAYCSSVPASTADSKITNFTLANINNTAPAGCTAYSDYTSLTAQLEQGKTYPLNISLGTCNGNYNKIAKVYIDWNGNGSFNDAGETVATTPVTSTTSTCTANITVPVTVIPDNYSLLRIVLTETTDTTAVMPCGNYAKGETQDYRVQFLKTSTDAGITGINNAITTGTCAGRTNITVHLKNFGSATLISIPVNVIITSPAGTTTTFNETYTGNLPPLAEDDFTLRGMFNTIAGAAYTVTATSQLQGDVVTTNNQYSINLVTGATPVPATLAAYYCNDSQKYLLTGSADGQLLWYANATDAVPLTYGTVASTTAVPVNNTYYAGINDFNVTVGPATKNAFTGGSYNQFTPAVIVSTQIPVIIQSARLYIGSSGRIRFTVTNASGQVVSTNTINVIATRSTPATGAQEDDPNDQGSIYTLNLSLPAAGNYTISLTYLNGATIFRSNSGVTGYPFTVNNIFTLSGNNAGTGASSLYYYFYNIQVISAGCSSLNRVAVSVTQPAISLNGTILSSNISSGNQWYLNGSAIQGATAQNYTPVVNGNYQLHVTLNSGCTLISNVFVYIKPGNASGNGADIDLSVFPVPASTQVSVALTAPVTGPLKLSIINIKGQPVYAQQATVQAGNYVTSLNVTSLVAGTYFLKVELGQKTYTAKIIINR